MPWYLGNSSDWRQSVGVIVPFAVWATFWTGLTLWHAARRKEKGWFIFFLFVHTAGIGELLYLFFIAKIFEKKTSRKK